MNNQPKESIYVSVPREYIRGITKDNSLIGNFKQPPQIKIDEALEDNAES